MARSIRLFDLIQALRRRRAPATAAVLAEEMGVSKRTLYRDIETLIALGAPIVGEAGIGYVLKPGFMLPPLMLTEEELEALALGGLWVTQRADPDLVRAAGNALAKISAVLPLPLSLDLDAPPLISGTAPPMPVESVDVSVIRQAIRREHKLQFSYADEAGAMTDRSVWPIALLYFDAVRMLVAWCESRQAFRHFRTDRISGLIAAGQRYPARRRALLKQWLEVDAGWRSRWAERQTAARN